MSGISIFSDKTACKFTIYCLWHFHWWKNLPTIPVIHTSYWKFSTWTDWIMVLAMWIKQFSFFIWRYFCLSTNIKNSKNQAETTEKFNILPSICDCTRKSKPTHSMDGFKMICSFALKSQNPNSMADFNSIALVTDWSMQLSGHIRNTSDTFLEIFS